MSDRLAEGAASLVAGLHGKIASDLAPFGGFLRCSQCRHCEPLSQDDIGTFLRVGWPKCHGHTMTWWTQRQIDAGEAPLD